MPIIPASHFQHLHPHDIDMLYEKSTQNAESSKHVEKKQKNNQKWLQLNRIQLMNVDDTNFFGDLKK